MRESARIVSLATALAALATPAAMPPDANASDSETSRTAPEAEDGISAQAEIGVPNEADLMSFTVQQGSDGMLFPQHGSHSSHASHASHASSSPGGGYGVPDLPSAPYVPYVPYVPNPVGVPSYVTPPAATTSPATTPPPATAADPKAVACTRASNGVGMIDIASELAQAFSLPDADAVYMAQQALIAVSGGNHYCDGYLGGHG